jgi:hypothetical protein
MNYTALKAEIQNDPASLGYSSYRASGNDAGLAILMNTPQVSATYKVNTAEISAPEFVNVVNRAEFDALSAADKSYLNWIIQAGTLVVSGGEVRNALASLFGVGTTSRTNFLALASKQISRSEYLFGTLVSSDDIAHARLA